MRSFAWLTILFLGIPALVRADSEGPQPFTELLRRTDRVVAGEVAGIEERETQLDVLVRVDDSLRTPTPASITFSVPTEGDFNVQLSPGQRVVVFLEERPRGGLQPVGVDGGLYRVGNLEEQQAVMEVVRRLDLASRIEVERDRLAEQRRILFDLELGSGSPVLQLDGAREIAVIPRLQASLTPEDVGRLNGFLAEARDLALRDEIASVVGNLGSPESVPELVRSLARWPDNTQAVTTALRKIGSPQVSIWLTRLLRSPESQVRIATVRAVAGLRAPQAEEELISVLQEDPSPEVRNAAAAALSTFSSERARAALERFRCHRPDTPR